MRECVVPKISEFSNPIEDVDWIASDRIIASHSDSSLRILTSNFNLENLQVHPINRSQLENERKMRLESLFEICGSSNIKNREFEKWGAHNGKCAGLKFALILTAWKENAWHRLDQGERVLYKILSTEKSQILIDRRRFS